MSDLEKILVWFLAVPLALAGSPPGLPVLHPVLDPTHHGKHVLLPLRLPGCLGGQLRDELNVGERSEQLLDSIVRDRVGSPQVSERFILYGD